MEDISDVLNKRAALDVAAQQSVAVSKVLEPEIDLGTLLCFDSNDFDTKLLRYVIIYYLRLTYFRQFFLP